VRARSRAATRNPESGFVVSVLMEKIYGPKVATLFQRWSFGRRRSVFALLLGYSRIPYAAALDGYFFKVSAAFIHQAISLCRADRAGGDLDHLAVSSRSTW